MNVFGPRYDDGETRCGDCHAGRFWRAVLAMGVIGGVAIALVSVGAGRWEAAAAGGAIAIVIGAFASSRIRAHDAAAGA